MKISIIGTGYVGLVQGAVFADSGNTVICMDIDEKKIASLRRGHVTIYEPGLEAMVRKNVEDRRLEFTTNLRSAVEHSDIIFLCLPTPQSDDGSADLSQVLKVAEEIGSLITGRKIIVSKSTVPVGTVDRIRSILRKKGRKGIDVVSNPEFLKEGAALQDSLKPDRIVIGTRSKRAAQVMTGLYSPFVRTGNPVLVMDERSAEMTKYASNAFLATKISFMNELANLCERTGADIDRVRIGMGSDPRIGPQFLFPGVGYGGSCFPKDVKALIRTAQDHEFRLSILKAVDSVNETQKRLLLGKISEHFGNSVKGKLIAVWGLAFKPMTDDMREAPSIPIVHGLLEMGVKLRAYDPVAQDRARLVFKNRIEYAASAFEALKGADALVVVTEWTEFRRPDFDQVKRLMKRPVVFDGRNIYDPHLLRQKGFSYFGIGR